MAGFVPGRDRMTQDALMPEEARRTREHDHAEHQAELEHAELAQLERDQAGAGVMPDAQGSPEHKGIVDRLLGR